VGNDIGRGFWRGCVAVNELFRRRLSRPPVGRRRERPGRNDRGIFDHSRHSGSVRRIKMTAMEILIESPVRTGRGTERSPLTACALTSCGKCQGLTAIGRDGAVPMGADGRAPIAAGQQDCRLARGDDSLARTLSASTVGARKRCAIKSPPWPPRRAATPRTDIPWISGASLRNIHGRISA